MRTNSFLYRSQRRIRWMTFDKMEFEGIQVFNSCSWSNDYKIRGKIVLLLKNLRRETALGKKLVFTQQRANGTILKEKQGNKGCFTLPFGEDNTNVGVRMPNPSSTDRSSLSLQPLWIWRRQRHEGTRKPFYPWKSGNSFRQILKGALSLQCTGTKGRAGTFRVLSRNFPWTCSFLWKSSHLIHILETRKRTMVVIERCTLGHTEWAIRCLVSLHFISAMTYAVCRFDTARITLQGGTSIEKNVSTILTYEKFFGAFSWLMIDGEGSSPLQAVPRLDW